jgi:hypothetical protein
MPERNNCKQARRRLRQQQPNDKMPLGPRAREPRTVPNVVNHDLAE